MQPRRSSLFTALSIVLLSSFAVANLIAFARVLRPMLAAPYYFRSQSIQEMLATLSSPLDAMVAYPVIWAVPLAMVIAGGFLSENVRLARALDIGRFGVHSSDAWRSTLTPGLNLMAPRDLLCALWHIAHAPREAQRSGAWRYQLPPAMVGAFWGLGMLWLVPHTPIVAALLTSDTSAAYEAVGGLLLAEHALGVLVGVLGLHVVHTISTRLNAAYSRATGRFALGAR